METEGGRDQRVSWLKKSAPSPLHVTHLRLVLRLVLIFIAYINRLIILNEMNEKKL